MRREQSMERVGQYVSNIVQSSRWGNPMYVFGAVNIRVPEPDHWALPDHMSAATRLICSRCFRPCLMSKAR